MTKAVAFPVRSNVAVELPYLLDSAGLSCGLEWPERPPLVSLGDKRESTPHIALDSDEPGIRGLFLFRPETAFPLKALSEVLLCGDSTLTRGERELIAAYVSALNQCRFCFFTHAAFAAVRAPEGMTLIEQVCADLETAPISEKLKALLAIAGAVQQGGKTVSLGDKRESTPHIALDSDEPGIRGLFLFRPETAFPLKALSEVLLCGDSTLTRGERELIAAYVSALNQCRFCFFTHAAFAAVRAPEGMTLIEQVCADLETAPISEKLKALLAIAGAVQQGGKTVSARHVAEARAAAASDIEIHDTVLIAAAFCMYNRYVDGLATFAPDDPAVYAARAKMTGGYLAVPAESQRQA